MKLYTEESDEVQAIILELMAFFPSLSQGMARRAVIGAVRSLSRYTPLFRETALRVEPGVVDYDLNDLFEPMEVEVVEWVKYCGKCLPIHKQCRDCQALSWEYEDEGKLLLYTPQGEIGCDDFTVRVGLTVPATSCMVPDKFVRRYRGALMDAAKSRLFDIPSSPWFNSRESALYGQYANAAMVDARTHQARKGEYGYDIAPTPRVL